MVYSPVATNFWWSARVFDGTVNGTFEGSKYPLPAGYNEDLTRLYGDYMESLPEGERGNHNIEACWK